jgi:hypothetical protein
MDESAGSPTWQDIGAALKGETSTHLPTGISLGDDETIVVVAGILNGNRTLAVRKLAKGSTAWTRNDFLSDRDMGHYDMKSNGRDTHLVVSVIRGEGVRVLKEAAGATPGPGPKQKEGSNAGVIAAGVISAGVVAVGLGAFCFVRLRASNQQPARKLSFWSFEVVQYVV